MRITAIIVAATALCACHQASNSAVSNAVVDTTISSNAEPANNTAPNAEGVDANTLPAGLSNSTAMTPALRAPSGADASSTSAVQESAPAAAPAEAPPTRPQVSASLTLRQAARAALDSGSDQAFSEGGQDGFVHVTDSGSSGGQPCRELTISRADERLQPHTYCRGDDGRWHLNED